MSQRYEGVTKGEARLKTVAGVLALTALTLVFVAMLVVLI